MSIYYQTFGQGDPLIIIHGLFGTSDNLKQVAKSLSDQFKVYLIDLPAHGDSTTIEPLTINNMAKEVILFSEQQGLTHFSLLGHSLGGKVSMEISMIAPEKVSKLIVADIAPVQYPRRHDVIINALKSVNLSQLKSRKDADNILAKSIEEIGVRGFLLKSLIRNPADTSQWKWRFDLASLADNYDNFIAAISSQIYDHPTLFVIGGTSDYVLPEHKRDILNRFPQVRVKVIQNAGHWLHAEKPTAFEKICRDFLNQ